LQKKKKNEFLRNHLLIKISFHLILFFRFKALGPFVKQQTSNNNELLDNNSPGLGSAFGLSFRVSPGSQAAVYTSGGHRAMSDHQPLSVVDNFIEICSCFGLDNSPQFQG
jgi:hypothetical protein